MGAQSLETELVNGLIQPLANKTTDPNYSPRQLGIDLFQGLNAAHHKAQQQGQPFSPQLLSRLSNTFSGLIGQKNQDNPDGNQSYQNSMAKTFGRFGTFLSIIDPAFAESQLGFMLTQQRSKEMEFNKQLQDRHRHELEEEEFVEQMYEEDDKKERDEEERYHQAEEKWLLEGDRHESLMLASEHLTSNVFSGYNGVRSFLKPNPVSDPEQNKANDQLKVDFQQAATSLENSLQQNNQRLALEQGEQAFRNTLNTMKQDYQTMVSTLHTMENNVTSQLSQDNINAQTRNQAQAALQNWHNQNQNDLRQFFSTGQVSPTSPSLDANKPNPATNASANANVNLAQTNANTNANTNTELQKNQALQNQRTQEQSQSPHPFDAIRTGDRQNPPGQNNSSVQQTESTRSEANAQLTPRKSPYSTAIPKPTDPPHP